MAIMIDHFGAHPLTMVILGHVKICLLTLGCFWHRSSQTIWLWFSIGCVARDMWKWEKMGKLPKALNCGRLPNLQAFLFYDMLVGGVSFKWLKTYGKLSFFTFLTLYQHLGPKGAKFCVLWMISTNKLNQAKCGHYKIQQMYGIMCHVWHHVASNSLDGLPVLGQAAFLFGQVHVTF